MYALLSDFIGRLNLHIIDYEPPDLTAHPSPPPELPKVGSLFSCRFLVLPKNVLKGKPEYFGDIQVKRPKNVLYFQHMHSNPIVIKLTFLDNNE